MRANHYDLAAMPPSSRLLRISRSVDSIARHRLSRAWRPDTLSYALPVRPTLTRHTALEAARLLYEELVERAVRVDDADVEYLTAVARDWSERLVALSRFRSDVTLNDHAREAFEFLRRGVIEPADDDATMRWVETFPQAISALFPPSASTFWVISEASGVRDAGADEVRAVAA